MRGQEKLDQFRTVMSWNQEELDQWAGASAQKEEDALALEKYRRQDEALIKDLTLQLERCDLALRGKCQRELEMRMGLGTS